MIKRPKVEISIPPNSSALQAKIEKALGEKYPSIDFTFVEGDIDSRCRILDSAPFWQSIQLDLARVERQFLKSA
jgi:hypothetical protein